MQTSLSIRPESKDERSFIYNLIKNAFSTAAVSSGTEQDFADMLRESVNYIPELALVAEKEDVIIGHIMLTRTFISTKRGNIESLLLAPVSIVEDSRRQGVGSALIREALNRASKAGFQSVFLVGDPDFYGRFDFRSAASFDISHSEEIPEAFVMALELVPGALKLEGARIDII